MDMFFELDHLAVAARTLDEGREWVESTLGTQLQPGGQHAHFGTHNLLLGLEDGLYLEVIAVDPGAPAPGYPRWFDLDRFAGPPRLTNWICRAENLAAAVTTMPQAGVPVALTRGDLRWQMAVPGDGILPYANMFPALMQWQSQPHPATVLAPSGCRLRALVIRHPEAAALEAEISGVMQDSRLRYETGTTGLMATFDTPHGPKVLG